MGGVTAGLGFFDIGYSGTIDSPGWRFRTETPL